MKNSPLHILLVDVLARYESIVFVLLFGSQCSGNLRFDSDIDIALYFEDIPDLLVIGEIISQLENATKQKIDLIVLNDLHAKNPLLAYNITGKHAVLINHDRDRYEAFKHRSYIDYFDFKPIIVAQNQKLIEELNHGNFGKAKRA
ncbi:MAG: type VII toxin-antitoxin system MntA family adenylyltransferase antitoxin [Sulfuricurvum sp.]